MRGEFVKAVAMFAAVSMAAVDEEDNAIRRFQKTATPATTIEFGDTTTFTVTTESYYNEDEGEQYFRITTVLTDVAIATDDIVEIEYNFQTDDKITDPVANVYKDACKCSMIINSQDTRFWTQTASDGHYKCTTQRCDALDTTWQDDTSPSDTDWRAPIIDDDPYDKFCEKYTVDTTHECKGIKCIIERKFDTGYNDDFRFLAESGTTAIDD